MFHFAHKTPLTFYVRETASAMKTLAHSKLYIKLHNFEQNKSLKCGFNHNSHMHNNVICICVFRLKISNDIQHLTLHCTAADNPANAVDIAFKILYFNPYICD